MNKINLIDCTFRDGGYYNNWDFPDNLVSSYLATMVAAKVDYVELGFRSFDVSSGFKGTFAYTTDNIIRSLNIPVELNISVMVNASEIVNHAQGPIEASKLLFAPRKESPVSLVRFACHVHEFEQALVACDWLKNVGYMVGINLMQVADRSDEEIARIAQTASQHKLDVLYFADSLGSMLPEHCAQIVKTLRTHWQGALGIHTHDNMGRAIANTLRAIDEGVTWVDSTVTGMGRGPGNAQTEYLLIELEKYRQDRINMIPLLGLVKNHLQPLKDACGWGINPYYYLAGKYGIHPTYIQEMLSDRRYNSEDILAVIEHLSQEGGKKFSPTTLEAARHFYGGQPRGEWEPAKVLDGRSVLIIGNGPSTANHRTAIEAYIRNNTPYVIALNTQVTVDESLIDIRAACHPVRLLADCSAYFGLPQTLAIPASMLPKTVSSAFAGKEMLDFGLIVKPSLFEFHEKFATIPAPLVIAYALAIATSGKARNIILAGFDGFSAEDPRAREMNDIFQ
uniref:aldolase catalytic domain-containing protein n=1 Tax=Rheinheimera sp. TaxID=1869214 RepID=UPI004047A1F1